MIIECTVIDRWLGIAKTDKNNTLMSHLFTAFEQGTKVNAFVVIVYSDILVLSVSVS